MWHFSQVNSAWTVAVIDTLLLVLIDGHTYGKSLTDSLNRFLEGFEKLLGNLVGLVCSSQMGVNNLVLVGKHLVKLLGSVVDYLHFTPAIFAMMFSILSRAVPHLEQ